MNITKLPAGWAERTEATSHFGRYTAFYNGKIVSGVGYAYIYTHPGAIFVKRVAD